MEADTVSTRDMGTNTDADKLVLAHVNTVLKSLKNSALAVANGEITSLNILSLCVSAMQCVETIPNLTGAMKKKIVTSALSELLVESKSDVGLINLVPSFIDTAISLEKGKVHISVTPEEMASCCATLCMAFASSKKK